VYGGGQGATAAPPAGAAPSGPADQRGGRGYPATYHPGSPLESSGSLTGHILAQGRTDGPTPKRSTAKVLIVMALVLVLLVAIGLLGATVARDTINDLLGGILGSG
jgi:hypothetical protein